MKTSFSLQDQETIIVVQPKQVADVADVYSNIPSMINKLKKLARERPDAVVITRDEGDAIFASVDPKCVKISPKRQMSEEQRLAAAERLAKARGDST